MSIMRVLISSSESLIGASLINILSGETDIDVVGMTSCDGNQLVTAIDQLKPDTIVSVNECTINNEILLANLFANHPKIMIITVSFADNWVHAYFKKDFLLSQSSDLAAIIRSQSSPVE